MNLRTYQAYSVGEALAQIRQDLGENAVILHTRTFKRGGWMGIGARTVVEVTASTASTVKSERRKTATTTRPSPKPSPKASPAVAPDPSAIAALLATAQSVRDSSPSISPTPAVARVSEKPASVRPSSAIPSTNSTSSPPPSTPAAPVARRFVINPPRPESTPVAETSGPVKKPSPSPLTPPVIRGAVNASANPAVSDELAALRRMVGQVLQRQSGSTQPAMPEELFNQYLALIENEVGQDLADEVCGQVRDELSVEDLKDPESVRRAVLGRIQQHIPTTNADLSAAKSADGRPFTLALVGPTGVGKTTTIAKLAASFKLRQGRRVGLITTDTYRIAAVDQLRTYANIIGIPLKVALTPTEMASACHELRDCEVVLIDTAGRSPNDSARIDEIKAFIDRADPHETHLVLSSTASETTLLKTVELFTPVDADRIIFTKLDEAVSFGVIVNVLRRVGRRLSFVTTGQEVPDQIEVGEAERLARLVLGEKLSG